MSDGSDKMSDGHMKDHRITVRFSPELRRRLKASAHRAGTRESDLVRGAVELQLAAEEGRTIPPLKVVLFLDSPALAFSSWF